MRVRPSLSFPALCCLIAVSFRAATLPGDQGDQSRVPAIAALGEKELAAIRIGLQEAAGPEQSHPRKLVRITAEPFHVEAADLALCRGPIGPSDPHDGWIHVYVTQRGQQVMQSGKGVYPPGTMILKQKFSDADGKKAEYFTGMVKRAKGYDPEAGDWEFFVMNSEATVVRPPLNVQSCVDCHAPFRATDFVSRRYLTAKVADGR
jgi:Cytochrome P460